VSSTAATHSNDGAGVAGLLAISAAGVLWGTTGVVVQYVNRTTGMGAVSIGFWRLVVAAVVLLAMSVPRLRHLGGSLRRQPLALVLAGLGLGFYQAAYFLSVVWVGVAIATLVSLGVAPVVITAWEAWRSRRRPPALRIVAVAAALVGLALVQDGGGGGGGSHPAWGLVAALVSGTAYAATAMLSSRLARTVPATVLTTVMCAVGAVGLLPLALLAPGPTSPPGGWAIGGLIYIGVACTALAYLLFNAGLRTVPSGAASILTLWEPLTATVLALLLLGETLTPLAVVGSALLLGSVALSYVRAAPA
jgi:DME family drug/metabolite transporter